MAAQVRPPTTEKAKVAGQQETIETITVDLSVAKSLATLPAAEVKDAPVRCSQSGMTFFDIYADSASPAVADFPQLWSIDHLGAVKQLPRKLPSGYKGFVVLDTFPSSQAFVSLIQAIGKVDPFNPGANRTLDYFIALSKYDGTAADPIRVDLKFSPRRIGALESGKFVLLGIDEANRVLRLAIIEPDGTLHKTLDLDSKSYERDGAPHHLLSAPKDSPNTEETSAVMRASSFADFVGDGPNVILFQNATRLPAKVIGDEGELSTFTLAPPTGLSILDVLASDRNGPIVARLQSEADLAKAMQGNNIPNSIEPIAEFSRDTGKMLKWIKVTGGPFPQEVSCATNRELTAIYWPPADEKAATDPSSKDQTITTKSPSVDRLLFAKAPF